MTKPLLEICLNLHVETTIAPCGKTRRQFAPLPAKSPRNPFLRYTEPSSELIDMPRPLVCAAILTRSRGAVMLLDITPADPPATRNSLQPARYQKTVRPRPACCTYQGGNPFGGGIGGPRSVPVSTPSVAPQAPTMDDSEAMGTNWKNVTNLGYTRCQFSLFWTWSP